MTTKSYQALCLKQIVQDQYQLRAQSDVLCWKIDATYCSYLITNKLSSAEQNLLAEITRTLNKELVRHTCYADVFAHRNILWSMQTLEDGKSYYQPYLEQKNDLTWVFLPDMTTLYRDAFSKKNLWHYLIQYTLHS